MTTNKMEADWESSKRKKQTNDNYSNKKHKKNGKQGDGSKGYGSKGCTIHRGIAWKGCKLNPRGANYNERAHAEFKAKGGVYRRNNLNDGVRGFNNSGGRGGCGFSVGRVFGGVCGYSNNNEGCGYNGGRGYSKPPPQQSHYNNQNYWNGDQSQGSHVSTIQTNGSTHAWYIYAGQEYNMPPGPPPPGYWPPRQY